MEITKQDWYGDVQIDERRMDRTAFIEMGGIAFSGATGTYSPLLSQAPGVAPGYRGGIERREGLALINQAELNTMSGDWFAYKNSEYPGIDIRLAGNYRHFDIAPQEKIPLSLSLTDTIRGILFASKNFFITRMGWDYNSELETFIPSISLSELTDGFDGDTVSIPPAPNIEAGGFNIPTINIPQINIPPFPTIVITMGGTNFLYFKADSASDGSTTFSKVPFVLSSILNWTVRGHILIPPGMDGTANLYAVFRTEAGVGLSYKVYIDADAYYVDNSGSYDYWTSDPDGFTLSGVGGFRWVSIGPLVISGELGGKALGVTLYTYDVENDYAYFFYGFYLQWV
jgi:hypothetical protein